METLEIQQMLLDIGALSQHEAAHYVTASALGFDATEIRLHYQIQPRAHRGKAHADYNIRCESLSELHTLMSNRVIIALSGAMGEAIDRSTYKVNGVNAYKILEEGATGAGQDFAVAKELVNLIHNSSPVVANVKTGKDRSSRDLLNDLLGTALVLVELNAEAICVIADGLAKRVTESHGTGVLQKFEIEQLLSPPAQEQP